MIIINKNLVRFFLLSTLLVFSGCFKYKMALPEIELVNEANQMKEEVTVEEFCEYISSIIGHQRNIVGRMYVSAPPIISFYALECLKKGMLKEKYFIFNVDTTEENLLYRSALCGEENAIALVRSSLDKDFKPRFSQRLEDNEYYLDDNEIFAQPSDDRFPRVSIDGRNFCGYGDLEFSITESAFNLLVAMPVGVVGVGIYLVSFGTINIFVPL
jgi:hypothetical protein